MDILREWINIFGKDYSFIDDLENNEYIEVNKLPQIIGTLIQPFVFGKLVITSKELSFINDSFRDNYSLRSFYKLYSELFLNSKINILPVISYWNNVDSIQYICLMLKGNLVLSIIEFPYEKCSDNLYIELYIKNYLQYFSNFEELKVNYNNSFINSKESKINLIDVSTFSNKDNFIGSIGGMGIGKYIITEDRILTFIGNKLKYCNSEDFKELDLRDIKIISRLLSTSSIVENKEEDKSLMNIKKRNFIKLREK